MAPVFVTSTDSRDKSHGVRLAAALGCSVMLALGLARGVRANPGPPVPSARPEVADGGVAGGRDVRAQAGPPPPADEDAIDYLSPRTELAGAPLIGGNSDIGLQLGLVLTATHFGEGVEPYAWNSDLVLAASLKGGPNGVEIAQQNYLLQLDLPNISPGHVRVTVTTSFQRTVDYGYYGAINEERLPAKQSSRDYQFDQREALIRTLTRVLIRKPYMLLLGANLRYVSPAAYEGSRLGLDAAAGEVRGLRPLALVSLALGVGHDSRDNEFFPQRGLLAQIGMKGNYALPLSAAVGYAAPGAMVAGYLPLGGPFVLAARGVADFQLGHVPFYDLSMGGLFQPDELPGGPYGVRGVPIGRYRGMIKLVGNLELRALLVRFKLLGTPFRFGGNLFGDVGRCFRDYDLHATPGRALDVLWGAGGGLYLQWGQAAVFRAEAAYSPDATANGGFPLGIYVAEGVMF